MADIIPVEGNLDLKGNQIKNVAIEVVTSLPAATYNFTGRQVTYQGRSYIWNGSAWKNDYSDIGGRNYANYSLVGKYLGGSVVAQPSIIKNSQYKHSTNGAPGDIMGFISYPLPKGKITISCKSDLESFNIYYNIKYSDGTQTGQKSVGKRMLVDGVFNLTIDNPEDNGILNIGLGQYPFVEDYWVADVKFEKGNIATDWTPAPEDKANENQTINFDTNNIEPTQSGTVTKTSTWLWQYLTQSINWLRDNIFTKAEKLTLSVTITDFNTFNPTTIGLAVGESCNFRAETAIGRPMFEVSTICTGTIQHVYTGHYVYIAYSGANTGSYPLQYAIGGYNSGFQGWQLRNAQGILDIIKTVDGTGSGLDADKLDGIESTGFAQLDENDKIKATNLPDYLLGQVLYGGSVDSSQECTFSSLYKDKFDTTDDTRLLPYLTASSHVGVYFIASDNFLLDGTIDVSVGDWVISDGNAWGKIDNTDAVASVNGKTGVVNLSYEDIGDIPEASDTKVGGIKIGYIEGLDANFLKGKEPSDFAGVDHIHNNYLGINAIATDTEVGGIKIGFTGFNRSIPVQLDNNNKAYIELLADNIRYAIANDDIINGKKYWLKNKTIIMPDGSADSGYSEGLRIANTPGTNGGYSTIALGTDNRAAGLNPDGKQWNIIKHPSGVLTISFDNGFDDYPTNSSRTGLTLYKNGDIYWKNAKLNLPRVSPFISGWLHYEDFTRFDRTADHAQITLISEELKFSEGQNYIGGHEIFGNDSPEFDDSGLYDEYGSYNLIEGRRYEVIINMGMHSSMDGVITLNLEKTGDVVIKKTSTTTNEGYLSMSLSCIVDCIVNGGIPISVSIQKSAGIELKLRQNQCWFAVHEIK